VPAPPSERGPPTIGGITTHLPERWRAASFARYCHVPAPRHTDTGCHASARTVPPAPGAAWSEPCYRGQVCVADASPVRRQRVRRARRPRSQGEYGGRDARAPRVSTAGETPALPGWVRQARRPRSQGGSGRRMRPGSAGVSPARPPTRRPPSRLVCHRPQTGGAGGRDGGAAPEGDGPAGGARGPRQRGGAPRARAGVDTLVSPIG
jgi:hypothetical protein